jgi:L-iditol 2-dehydrogenase
MPTISQALAETSAPQVLKQNGTLGHVPQRLMDKLSLGGVVSDGVFRRAPGPNSKPNVALWVTKEHQLYQEEIPYPVCGPNDW